ncbi:MAG: sugar ABC transporter ATP-binding protein [Chitinophagaceae bacterium]
MLQLKNISKSFPGVKALHDISLEFKPGEVHALCGENGAGKTTLMNILVGNIQPDEGSIFLSNKKIGVENIQVAQGFGISIVYQERSLVDSLTVAENIYPVNQPLNRFGLINYRQLYKQTQALLDELQLTHLSPVTKVEDLSSSQKQMVEIAKALAQDPSWLILDEPTASITNKETEILFSIIRKLKAKGVAVIYISHRMAEIKTIADIVSILKDGIFQGSYDAASTPVDIIIAKMVGRDLQQAAYISHKQKEVALEVKNLSGKGFSDISFVLHKGEILGIAGLQGSGRTELALAIFGDIPFQNGKIIEDGISIHPKHPADCINLGMAYIPEDRKAQGLFMEQAISDNIIAAHPGKGLYNRRESHAVSESYRVKLSIRATHVQQKVQKLSGGNQQKVVLAKWLHTEADIFIINEPTHGVDVGAKAEIYSELRKLTAEGKSILLISSELPELLLLSDRIAVMYKGNIQGIIEHDNANEENITAMASGM